MVRVFTLLKKGKRKEMSSHNENNDRSNYTPAAGASGSVSNIPFITDNVTYTAPCRRD